MTKHFHYEIERLKRKILHLAAMVEEALRAAVKAASERNIKLAECVISGDPEIDAHEINVEEDCLKILALHQPVAADLRYVVAVMKINNDLERIADLAVNIAELTPELAKGATREIPFDLNGMFELSLAMVAESTDALIEFDADKAYRVCKSDDKMDEMYHRAKNVLEDSIRNNCAETGYYMGLLGISRNLERIADHATNIAEDVIYLVEGEIVRHGLNS